jgi:hypothetical protein
VLALAREVSPGCDEDPQVELVDAQLVGNQLVAAELTFGVHHPVIAADGAVRWHRATGAGGEVDGLLQVDLDESGDFGIGEGDLGQAASQCQQRPVLKLPLDAVGSERDRGLADAERLQVVVGHR